MTAKRRMTMADIKHAAQNADSPYFDRGNKRFFGKDTHSGPYVGPGGIYFAQSNRAGHRIKHVTLEPFRITTKGEARSHTDARDQAKALARAGQSHAKKLHFAGYDFTSGPEGTVIHRPAAQSSSFHSGDRVEYRDVNLTQQGTVSGSDGKWIMVRWDGRPFESREWAPNLRHAGRAAHAKKKTPAQLQREIDEALSGTAAVKCPSPDHPLYPELRRIRQIAHDTSWSASQLAQDAERAFRNGDCAKAAEMLEAAKGVIAKARRKRR